MSESGKTEQNIQLATLNPKLLLKGENPRLVDEWEIAPQVWDSIRFQSDHRNATGAMLFEEPTVCRVFRPVV